MVKALDAGGIDAAIVEPTRRKDIPEAVNVGTMHRMKGLEHRRVAVVDVSDGRMPLPWALTSESEDPLQHGREPPAAGRARANAERRRRRTLSRTGNGLQTRGQMRLRDVDTAALRVAISGLGHEFDTYEVSKHPAVERAHDAYQGDHNYHAMVGKALKDRRHQLGIRYLGQTGRRRSALWERVTSHQRPEGQEDADTASDLDLLDPGVRPLVEAVLARGAPPPVVGHELGEPEAVHGWQVEVAWPRQRVAILTDQDPERDRWLGDEGWHATVVADWDANTLASAVTAGGAGLKSTADRQPEHDPLHQLSRAALEQEHCWFDVDRVGSAPEVTQFKRRARLHQARWRRRRGLPIGVQVRRDGTEKPVGSRVALDVAMDTGANFLSEQVRRAVEHRLDNSEPHQMIDESRLWSDLLSSMPLCFNLFGELWADRDRAAAAVTAWFPDAPGTVAEIRFEWSPGRLDPNYLGNRSAFDGAFLLDLGDGRRSVIGVETKHHEHAARQQPPSEARLARYREVAERAGVFREGWEAPVVGTDLQQLWLDHLLALSMLQHPEGRWGWARFVLVHPARNPSFAEAATRYRDVLTDTSTFDVRAVEEFIDAEAALPRHLAEEFRERYLRMLDTGEP